MQELLKKLKNLRTLLVYENVYSLEYTLFNEILPTFKDLKTFYIIYSECANRTLKIAGESFKELNKETEKILKNCNIIKIGRNSKIPFGKLYKFITFNENYTDFLKDALENVEGLILFYGFSILVLKSDVKDLVELFDIIPEDVTLICECNKNVYRNEFSIFFDAVLSIREDEMSLGEFQVLEVLYSSKLDLIPGTCERFRWEYARV